MKRLPLYLCLVCLSTLTRGAFAEDASALNLQRLIDQLDDDDSEIRAQAYQALDAGSAYALGAVKAALEQPRSLEQAQRLRALCLRHDGFGAEKLNLALSARIPRTKFKAGETIEFTVSLANRGVENREIGLYLVAGGTVLGDLVSYNGRRRRRAQAKQQQQQLEINNDDQIQVMEQVEYDQQISYSTVHHRFGGVTTPASSIITKTIQLELTDNVVFALRNARKDGRIEIALRATAPIGHYYLMPFDNEIENAKLESQVLKIELEE